MSEGQVRSRIVGSGQYEKNADAVWSLAGKG